MEVVPLFRTIKGLRDRVDPLKRYDRVATTTVYPVLFPILVYFYQSDRYGTGDY